MVTASVSTLRDHAAAPPRAGDRGRRDERLGRAERHRRGPVRLPGHGGGLRLEAVGHNLNIRR